MCASRPSDQLFGSAQGFGSRSASSKVRPRGRCGRLRVPITSALLRFSGAGLPVLPWKVRHKQQRLVQLGPCSPEGEFPEGGQHLAQILPRSEQREPRAARHVAHHRTEGRARPQVHDACLEIPLALAEVKRLHPVLRMHRPVSAALLGLGHERFHKLLEGRRPIPGRGLWSLSASAEPPGGGMAVQGLGRICIRELAHVQAPREGFHPGREDNDHADAAAPHEEGAQIGHLLDVDHVGHVPGLHRPAVSKVRDEKEPGISAAVRAHALAHLSVPRLEEVQVHGVPDVITEHGAVQERRQHIGLVLGRGRRGRAFRRSAHLHLQNSASAAAGSA
eukprot:scaffold63_cov306-Pinguiococcus_pyrenoidosus.AAC.58